MSFNDTAIVTVGKYDCRICFWNVGKAEVVIRLEMLIWVKTNRQILERKIIE